MTWVEIDLNCRIGRGMTFSGIEDCDGPVEPGQVVNVRESESGIWGSAMVDSIDHRRGLVFLSIAWNTLQAPVDVSDLVAEIRRSDGEDAR